MSNDYTTAALIRRVTLKAFTSTSTSLSSQEVMDLCNDTLRSYIVPRLSSFRDEWFVGKDDIVLTSDADGKVTIPDTVASSLRTVSWNNAGYITPLSRIEPENSFQYLSQQGQLPCGFMMRGYTLQLLPKTPGIAVHLTGMLRPPQMVLTEKAGLIDTVAGATLTLDAVPLAWQETAPTSVDVISGESPFSPQGTFDVASLVGDVLTLTEDPGASVGWYVSDVDTSPFANVPIELYPLIEADVRVELFTGLGDKRLAGAEKRRDFLEAQATKAEAPRTQGNSRPIVSASAPGMRATWGSSGWGRR